VGTLIPFPARRTEAARKVEAILERIRHAYRAEEQAREALPRVLAELVQRGETEAVLRTISLWGSGQVEPIELLRALRSLDG